MDQEQEANPSHVEVQPHHTVREGGGEVGGHDGAPVTSLGQEPKDEEDEQEET